MVDEQEEKLKEKPKSKKSALVKWLAGFFFVTTWIGLIIIKIQTDVSLVFPVIISVVISIICLLIIFGSLIRKEIKKRVEKEKDEEIVPKAVSEERVYDILHKTADKLMNHIKEIQWNRSDDVNKNLIYTFKVKLLYEDEVGDEIYVIINANFPDEIPTILPVIIKKGVEKIPLSDYYLGKAINSKSHNPEPNPDVTETTVVNPILGIEEKKREVKHTKKQKKKEEKEDSVV